MFSNRAGLKAGTTSASAAFIAMLALAAGCDTVPTTPSAGPTITCPAAQTAPSATGGAVTVDYPKPAMSGGVDPVTLTCKPAAGSSFPLGTTSVTCSAVDANQKSASCSFNVTVAKAPQIALTKFLAFGDSITAGKSGESCPAGGGSSCTISTTRFGSTSGLRNHERWFINLEESTAAYPRALQALLANRYQAQAQSITIANEGLSGEAVSAGKDRLHGLLIANPPQVLLLQEGANDMTGARPPIDALVADFTTMIRDARARGVRVFLGTVLPERPGACRAGDFCDGVYDTVALNAKLRAMAAAEGAIVVDLYVAFDGQTSSLLALDGLHPNEAGYAKMAETFYNVIRQQLEVP